MVGQEKKGFRISTLLLIVLAVIQLFPLIWLIDFSLVESDQLFTSGILVWPSPFRWVNYTRALFESNFLHYLFNSILINALAVILVVVFATMASFACTRMRWKLSGFVSLLLMMGLMIPIRATLLPNYIIFSKIKILDTILALLIPYVAFSLPQGFFLTSSYMDSVPKELEEAAVIDGCGVYRTLMIIVLPMMKASIATVSIMTYLNNWNEFVMAMTFLSSPDWKTLPFAVLEFTGQYSSDYAIQFAVMTLSALPAIVIYILLNKNITKGVAMGAVKG